MSYQEALWAPQVPNSKVQVWGGKQPEDPRPDLSYDSADWTKLLRLANEKDKMLAGTLHGFRCGGLRLHRGGKGYALRPEFDPNTSEWKTEAEYVADRDKWLMPHQAEIVELLKRL